MGLGPSRILFGVSSSSSYSHNIRLASVYIPPYASRITWLFHSEFRRFRSFAIHMYSRARILVILGARCFVYLIFTIHSQFTYPFTSTLLPDEPKYQSPNDHVEGHLRKANSRQNESIVFSTTREYRDTRALTHHVFSIRPLAFSFTINCRPTNMSLYLTRAFSNAILFTSLSFSPIHLTILILSPQVSRFLLPTLVLHHGIQQHP